MLIKSFSARYLRKYSNPENNEEQDFAFDGIFDNIFLTVPPYLSRDYPYYGIYKNFEGENCLWMAFDITDWFYKKESQVDISWWSEHMDTMNTKSREKPLVLDFDLQVIQFVGCRRYHIMIFRQRHEPQHKTRYSNNTI